MNRFLLAHVTSLPKTRRCHEPPLAPRPDRSGWLAVLAAAALLWGCASPTSDGGGTGGSHVGGSSGATGSARSRDRWLVRRWQRWIDRRPAYRCRRQRIDRRRRWLRSGRIDGVGGIVRDRGFRWPGRVGRRGDVWKGRSIWNGRHYGNRRRWQRRQHGRTRASCTPGAPWTGGQQYSSNGVNNVGNGYSYQLYFAGGSGSMTVAGGDARFSATWNNPDDFLARVGLTWSSTQTFDQLGTVSADFAHTKTGDAGFSFIGIYGWSVNPIVEYYIVEDWYGSRPTAGGTKMGTFTVDGGTYDVYQHTQMNVPSVTGANATFPQFFSIRQTARQCGHVSITEHYKEWARLGLTLGKMEEAKILVETGAGGVGSITFTTATVTAK